MQSDDGDFFVISQRRGSGKLIVRGKFCVRPGFLECVAESLEIVRSESSFRYSMILKMRTFDREIVAGTFVDLKGVRGGLTVWVVADLRIVI